MIDLSQNKKPAEQRGNRNSVSNEPSSDQGCLRYSGQRIERDMKSASRTAGGI